MKTHFTLKKNLRFLLISALAAGSGSLVASPDDDDHPGLGGGGDGDYGGPGGNRAEVLSAVFMPVNLLTKGSVDAQYFPFRGTDNIALNADVRLALEKLDVDGNILAVLNPHLGITTENYQDSRITLFIGTDEDGDGTCLSEGPTSICVFNTSGGHDLEINDDGILHAAWAIALRSEDGYIRDGGTGTCYTDFESTEVVPQFDELGNMTSVVFNIVGGEDYEMPEINDGDGCMVGYGAPWLGFADINCGADTSCQIIPILMGNWKD